MVLALAAPCLCAADKDPNDERLARATSLRGDASPEQQDEALNLCREVLTDPNATRPQQFSAFKTRVDILWYRRRDAPAAAAVLDEMRAHFPGDAEADRTASFRAADVLWESGKDLEKAVDLLAAFAERSAADPAALAQARLRRSRFLLRLRRFDEAYAAASQAIDGTPDDPELAAAALWEMQNAAEGMKDPERRYQALRRALEPRYLNPLDPGGRAWRLAVFGQVLLGTRRFDELRTLFGPLEQAADQDPGHRQEWCLLLAEALVQEERLDAALPVYERVIAGHPETHNHWWTAQVRIVDILRRQNRFEEALRATRVLLDAAWDHNTLTHASEQAVALLVAIDDLPDRANPFIAWQTYGPAGKDAIPGTADDPADPMAACPYPDLTARAEAFDRASAGLGDTATAARQRAFMALYSGKPREALAHLADAMARSGIEDLDWLGPELVHQALRAAVGHTGRTEEFAAFVAWGPAGPDRVAGTADDRRDPFAEFALPPAPVPGGLARLPAAEVTALEQLGAALQALFASTTEQRHRRTACARGLARVQEALASWQPEPLRDLARDIALSTDDRELTRVGLLLGAQCAKGRDLHLGGVHAFVKAVDADCQARGVTLGEGVADLLPKRLERLTDNLTRQKPIIPRLKPIPVILGDSTALPPQPPATPAPGLKVAFYELDPKAKPRELPDFATLTPKGEAITETIGTQRAPRGEHVALRFSGYLQVPRSTGYRFHLRSKDGSRLLIGETEVINYDGLHGAGERAGVINLQAGYHPLTLLYFCGQGGAEVRLNWESYGIEKQEVPATALFHDGP